MNEGCLSEWCRNLKGGCQEQQKVHRKFSMFSKCECNDDLRLYDSINKEL